MLRRIGLISALLVLLSAASVSASTHTITVTTFAYPASTPAVIGDVVRWKDAMTFDHTVTSNAPLALWNKSLPAGGSTQRTFTAAGSFPYHCSIHPEMQGDIVVGMTASPTSGATTTTFTIRWATVSAASGFRYVVQQRAPGGSFTKFKTTAAPSAAFHATSAGTWSFRAKLKRTSNGATSGFSPALSISVS